MAERVIVTGGAGYIGSVLIAELRLEEDEGWHLAADALAQFELRQVGVRQSDIERLARHAGVVVERVGERLRCRYPHSPPPSRKVPLTGRLRPRQAQLHRFRRARRGDKLPSRLVNRRRIAELIRRYRMMRNPVSANV